MRGYGGGEWGHPQVSITCHERLPLLVFSASLLPVATLAPSFCLPDSPSDLASLLPPGTPHPAWSIPEVQRGHCCHFLLMSKSLLDKLVTLEDFICLPFKKLYGSTYTDYPTSDVTTFHPIWKEVYQSLDTQSWVWKKLISLMMCGLHRFM